MSHRHVLAAACFAAFTGAGVAHADAVTDWNARAGTLVAAEKLAGAYGYRAMAIVQVATRDAVDAARRSKSASADDDAVRLAAAVAAANRATLAVVVPGHRADADAAYAEAIGALADSPARRDGIAAGERAAAELLERRARDLVDGAPAFRPRVEPGVWQPTAAPVAAHWPERAPWFIGRADRFRPGPPPALDSARFAADLEEIKAAGARDSTVRTADQTEAARFWEATTPSLYFDVARSLAAQASRDVVANAHLLARVAVAMDDALIAAFEAKYHYQFWRPITAIRNADRDGNPATTADPAWVPLIDTPMHPEYPCAHCILASTVGGVLAAEPGSGATTWRSHSPTLPGVERSWTSLDAFVAEVSQARINDGVHFRYSTEVATAMGHDVAGLALREVR